MAISGINLDYDHIDTDLQMELSTTEEDRGKSINQITNKLHDVFDSSDILYDDIKILVEAFISNPKKAFLFEPVNESSSHYSMKTSLRIPSSSLNSYCYELMCIKNYIEEECKYSSFIKTEWKLYI